MTRPPGKRTTRTRRATPSPATPSRGRSVAARPLLVVVVNLLVLVALCASIELAARLWFPRDLDAVFDNPQAFRHNRPYVQDDARRGFVLRPGYSTPRLTVTRDGFRANAPELQEAPWARNRIVCLGGSTTFGWGLADHESYPAQLQKQLERVSAESVSVVNAGVPSYTSEQVVLYLETALDMQPRLVIVQSMWNDLLFSFVDNWFADLLVHQRPARWRRALLKHSAAYRALFLKDTDATQAVRCSPQALEHYRDNLQRIVDRCRQAGVPLAFSLPPLQEDHIPQAGMRIGDKRVPREAFLAAAQQFTDALEDVARSNQVPVVHHRVAHEAHPQADLFLDAAHPKAEGYRLLVEDLLAALQQRNLSGVALVDDH